MQSQGNKYYRETIGGTIPAAIIGFCMFEMVPGWEIFDLEWSRSTFYAIAVLAGAIGGCIGVARYRSYATIGGAIAAAGALFAVSYVLGHLESVRKIELISLAGLGAAPGFLIYLGLKRLHVSLFGDPPGPSEPEMAMIAECDQIRDEINAASFVENSHVIEFERKARSFGLAAPDELQQNWKGELAGATAAFVNSSGEVVLATRDEVAIRITGKKWRSAKLKARFQVGHHRFSGTISPESYERFAKWKENSLAVPGSTEGK